MIWEPFILALVLGIIVSAGLYFAYLWPSVEPAAEDKDDDDEAAAAGAPAVSPPASPEAATERAPAVATQTDDATSPAP